MLNERFISVGRGVNVRSGISAVRNPIPLASCARELGTAEPARAPGTARHGGVATN